MALYAIGDIQGCFKTFMKLLDTIKFNDSKDTLYLLGDVVNRGPDSLKVLRFIKDHPQNIKMILGNHDVFAISLFYGLNTHKEHTLHDLLQANDALELRDFLKAQPFMLQKEHNVFVHAGILPIFSLEQALTNAKKLAAVFCSEALPSFLRDFYQKHSKNFDPQNQALFLSLESFIHLRTCESPTKMDTSGFTGELKDIPKNLTPWFCLRNDVGKRVFFGHWSAIGFFNHNQYFALDSGCLWGRTLSAYNLDSNQLTQVANCEDK